MSVRQTKKYGMVGIEVTGHYKNGMRGEVFLQMVSILKVPSRTLAVLVLKALSSQSSPFLRLPFIPWLVRTCPKAICGPGRVQLSHAMPVATTSRQKSSRQRDPSSDGIEEIQASQRRIANNDELEDEVEEQPKRSTKGRKGNPAGAMGSETEESGYEDEELEDDSRINVNNFKDQPLIKAEAGKIKGVASDWENIRTQSQNTVKGLMDNVGTSLADLMQPDEAEKVCL